MYISSDLCGWNRPSRSRADPRLAIRDLGSRGQTHHTCYRRDVIHAPARYCLVMLRLRVDDAPLPSYNPSQSPAPDPTLWIGPRPQGANRTSRAMSLGS